MKVSPIKKYKAPKYPDKKLILENPSMLRANLPQRWKYNIRAVTALTALLAISAAGFGKIKGSSNSPTAEKELLAAPIFEHGDGRGSFGCVSVSPPAFLSEEEAFDVICSEAEKMGLSLEKDGYVLENVNIPLTSFYYDKTITKKQKGSLELDGVDKKLKIGVEFISNDDYDAWEDKKEGIWSSVSSYNFLSAANVLRDGINESPDNLTVGIFYDPMPELDREAIFDEDISFEEKDAMLHEMSVELLRNQVKDFLEWLKGEGIL